MSTDFDIAIAGAGPVGLTLAALLVKQGIAPARIVLLDAKSLEQTRQDPRAIALSAGSRQILDSVQAWPLRAASSVNPATPIQQIHVSRRGHFGRTLIDCADYDLPALGYVAAYAALVETLTERVAQLGVTLWRPFKIQTIDETDAGLTLRFAERAALTAQLLIQAEGGVFDQQIARTRHRDYQQSAVVAHVRSSQPIAARAYERFTDQGPLALLPQDDGYALVWCLRPEPAQALAALPDADFLSELQQTFGERVGRFLSATPRNVFALGLNAEPAATARSIAIGNAAQTLHPVAGQGLNLGLRDAFVLARILADEFTPAALSRYATARAADRKLTIGLTDAMARIFALAPTGSVLQSLLGLSLAAIDVVQPVKSLLAQQMMFGYR